MKYRHAQLVKRSIVVSVAWEAELVMGAVKRGTKLNTIQGGIEHKELEHRHRHQHQSNNLHLEGGKINHGKVELLPLYQETIIP